MVRVFSREVNTLPAMLTDVKNHLGDIFVEASAVEFDLLTLVSVTSRWHL